MEGKQHSAQTKLSTVVWLPSLERAGIEDGFNRKVDFLKLTTFDFESPVEFMTNSILKNF